MKRILTFVVIAAGVTGIGFAAASSSDTLLPEKHGSAIREIVRTAVRHVLNFRKETPLTAEQRASVAKILETHREEIRTQMTKGRDARRAMAEAAKKDANSAATRAAAEKLGDLTRDRALLIAKIGSEVRPLLTPEQQKHIETARGELESLVDAALGQIGG
jgi:Spy/CpxP family protein refolding chaperone